MCFESVYHLTGIDLHELDHVGVHADEHVSRVLTYRYARQLDIVYLPLADLFVADEVKYYDRALGDDNKSLSIW